MFFCDMCSCAFICLVLIVDGLSSMPFFKNKIICTVFLLHITFCTLCFKFVK